MHDSALLHRCHRDRCDRPRHRRRCIRPDLRPAHSEGRAVSPGDELVDNPRRACGAQCLAIGHATHEQRWLCQLDLAPVRRLDLAPVRGRRTLGPDCGAFGSEDDDGGA